MKDYIGILLVGIMYAVIFVPFLVESYYSRTVKSALKLQTTYKYELNFPKNRRGPKFMRRYRIATLLLPKSLPNIYLDCHIEQKTRKKSVLIDPKQKIELEGNFHKSYTLFAPQDAKVLALSIFSPNIMEALLDAKLYCDIEIISNKIVFHSIRTDIRNVDEFTSLIRPLIDKIDHKLTTWSEQNENQSRELLLQSSSASQVRIGSSYHDLRHISAIAVVTICAALAILVNIYVADNLTTLANYLIGAGIIFTIGMIYFLRD